MDVEKIYNAFLPLLNESYNYLLINNQEFSLLINDIVNKFSNLNLEDLKKKVITKLNEELKHELNNPETSLKVINNYLNLKFALPTTYEMANQNIKKITNLLKKNNYSPNPDIITRN